MLTFLQMISLFVYAMLSVSSTFLIVLPEQLVG